jgi:hypothetical protein
MPSGDGSAAATAEAGENVGRGERGEKKEGKEGRRRTRPPDTDQYLLVPVDF